MNTYHPLPKKKAKGFLYDEMDQLQPPHLQWWMYALASVSTVAALNYMAAQAEEREYEKEDILPEEEEVVH